MKRPKIKACHSAWKAYRAAFIELSYLMAKEAKITNFDKNALEAYRKIMNYERSSRRKMKRGIIKTDWELFKESYENALTLFNRLNAIESRSELEKLHINLRQEEKEFLFGFVELLEYACNGCLGNYDYRKVRDFTQRIKAAANHKNRMKA